MKCKNCKREIDNNLNFCKYCGEPVLKEKENLQNEHFIICKNCNQKINAKNKFCTNCGEILGTENQIEKKDYENIKTRANIICPNCHESIFADNQFCTKCGHRLDNRNQKERKRIKARKGDSFKKFATIFVLFTAVVFLALSIFFIAKFRSKNLKDNQNVSNEPNISEQIHSGYTDKDKTSEKDNLIDEDKKELEEIEKTDENAVLIEEEKEVKELEETDENAGQIEEEVDEIEEDENSDLKDVTNKPYELPTVIKPLTDEEVDKLEEEKFESDFIFKIPDRVEASSSLTENGYTHEAKNVIDTEDGKAWVEGAKGQGIGESLSFYYDQSEKIEYIIIWAGYQKSEKTYIENSRPKDITLILGDGTELKLQLDDIFDGQLIKLPQIIETDKLIFVIDSVYEGNVYEDTAFTFIAPFIYDEADI